MDLHFPRRVIQRSKVVHDFHDVVTYGRYVMLIYPRCNGSEHERPAEFRRRLSFGDATFQSYVVRGSVEHHQHTSDHCSSAVSGTDSRTVCSFSDGWTTDDNAVRESALWVVMVRLDHATSGYERFRLRSEGMPTCLVKRDLNYSVHEWLEVCQNWMNHISDAAESAGQPITVLGESKDTQQAYPNSTPKTSEYFSTPARRAVNRSKICEGHTSSSEAFVDMPNDGKSKFRNLMSEHRIVQLEARVRSLEELLVKAIQ